MKVDFFVQNFYVNFYEIPQQTSVSFFPLKILRSGKSDFTFLDRIYDFIILISNSVY